MKIYRTAEWQARPPRAYARRSTPTLIVIHHTATRPSKDRSLETAAGLARAIQRHHMDSNGWDDSGHNFLVSVQGYVMEGRHGSMDALEDGESIISAHSGNAVANASFGIENEGCYGDCPMPDEQWQSLVELCTFICRKQGLAPDCIKGHRDFRATECPGDWLYAKLPELRKAVAINLEKIQ